MLAEQNLIHTKPTDFKSRRIFIADAENILLWNCITLYLSAVIINVYPAKLFSLNFQPLEVVSILLPIREFSNTLLKYSANLIYLIFQPLEVVSRYRDAQPQVVQNYSYLFNLRPNIDKY